VDGSTRALTSLVVVPGIGAMARAAVGDKALCVGGGVTDGGSVAVTNGGDVASGVMGVESQLDSININAAHKHIALFMMKVLYPKTGIAIKQTHPRRMRSG
jgi:hypothetical protein